MSFKNSEYYDSVQRVRCFMYGNIQKTLDLTNTNKGAPNFLLALDLCCYTEYWGKLLLETPKDSSRNAFNAFFKRLGTYYENLINNDSIDVYRDIRCGLAHAYLVEGRNAIIDIGYGPHGVDYDAESNKYTFYVSTYFEDFKNAVNTYING
jgi:hypothetical protein